MIDIVAIPVIEGQRHERFRFRLFEAFQGLIHRDHIEAERCDARQGGIEKRRFDLEKDGWGAKVLPSHGRTR